MSRFFLFIFLIFLTGCNSKKLTENKNNEKPNILLIVADDLGYGDLRCYGNKIVDTPQLDKLAENGVRFTNAYASCTVCSPTRASLLTGKNPVALNLTDFIPGRQANGPQPHHKLISPDFNKHLPLDEMTIAEQLKKLGYTTASIGKWHLGGKGYLPPQHGFDLNIAGNAVGMPPSFYYPYTSNEKWRTHKITPLELTEDSLYLTERLTNEAIQFIESSQDKPFFLYLPYYTVHIPVEGPKALAAKYAERLRNSTDTVFRHPHYLAMTESLDENVGRIVAALEKLNLERNTLIIFVSDNGGWAKVDEKDGGDQQYTGWQVQAADNGPLRGGKGTLYEGGLRVPVIISWPGTIEPGRVSDELVISTDVFPTIMEAVQMDIDYPVEGVSLLSFLTENKPVKREKLYWHYPHYHLTTPGSVIRDGDFKLIKYYEDDRLELYNLKNDVGESNDLSGTMSDKTIEMHRKLNKWLEKEDAGIPVPNSGYRETANN